MTRITLRPAKRNFPARPGFDLFGDFFKDWDEFFKSPAYHTQPAVNITELDDRFDLTVAAPGLSKEDFEIQIDNNIITIRANKEVHDENTDYKVREFHYTEFQRTFQLPETVDGTKITAKYENGLLNVALPKKDEAKVQPAKKITIS
jgi:HSP20 family protein